MRNIKDILWKKDFINSMKYVLTFSMTKHDKVYNELSQKEGILRDDLSEQINYFIDFSYKLTFRSNILSMGMFTVKDNIRNRI